ncbi:MAG: Uma2 family endonuclease [Spirochaeta sp.]|jgi:Uma2 family endonuclease|nr:Uma2 family endonuclease [Spirochaeta sp.]
MAPPKEQSGGYTYGDYKTWTDDERWELIDGVAWNMSPAPSPGHQSILGSLCRKIADITDRTGCTTFVAPFDVRLPDNPAQSEDDTPTVVQPDISVFCDPSRLDDKGAHAAPDLVVEILSPSTGYKDQIHKLALYERHGVREYWVVNGDAGWVMVYRLESDRRYGKPDYYRRDESIRSDVLEGAEIAAVSFLSEKA